VRLSAGLVYLRLSASPTQVSIKFARATSSASRKARLGLAHIRCQLLVVVVQPDLLDGLSEVRSFSFWAAAVKLSLPR